jgi:site-specific recombinase XerD
MTISPVLVTHYDDNPIEIINLVIDGLTSNNSKRAYAKALTDFLAWYRKQEKPGLSKATVQRYKVILQELGLAPSSINQRISAIRKLAQEAADNGLVDQAHANGVARVKGVKQQGTRAGNWLTREQAQLLVNSPELTSDKGKRDRAILAIMLGAGLRRSEVVALNFAHIQQREGRWVVVDIVGKGNRLRTIPIPAWVKVAIDDWTNAIGIIDGLIFRRVNKGDKVMGYSLTAQAVRDVVSFYSTRLGFSVAAHDLRRTFAKLAHKGGAGLDQIQLSLGHASIKTTERYLGITQNLTDAPCDHLGIKLRD